MSKKIYVGNLSYSTKDSDLGDYFAEFGEVLSVDIITDRVTDRSKGFGFVEMSDDGSATKAISALDGKEIDGRRIKVSEALEKRRF